MFHVPRQSGGHPRLALAILAALLVLVAGLIAWASVRMPPLRPDPEPLPPRPPVEVVEALPRLKAQLDRWGGSGQFTGGVLVARGDEVLFRQVHGYANRSQGQPLALNSRFRLASVSKQFTAAAILRLQDEGVLSTHDPLCRWIQPCPPAWEPIRLYHLLGHSSGIPDLMARPAWGVRRVTPASMEELTAESAQYGLQFAPGTRVRYNNAAYNLLGAVIEKATGKPLHDYLRTAFFEPLGMDDTGYDDDVSDVVMGYANLGVGPSEQPNANVSIIVGAGAMYSTLDDLLVWQRTLHGGHLLTPRSYAMMIKDHAPETTPDERGQPRRDWGFGLFSNSLGRRVSPDFLDRQIYHTGSWSGFRNLMTWQPDADVTVIVLSNNYHQRDAVFLLSQQAMAEALGRPLPTAMAR
ncbi:MAG: serine hydrolase domain-containing protein [Brevundimonas sp.]|uniref:serine hydrolase domain-containing protein n=1 Tax=Brevundimonas sp. TaxID=1871086 RepID=UPI002733EF4E|nr:serine hydrolase domain-containing protein [Brevundimonas sp.]MDP3656673.1 serine hydrolase domain-containing protein [Brevundimonas sp.]MDZ4114171.1 serine hydrolase domain-containing protein [Brevundimonas sp.]